MEIKSLINIFNPLKNKLKNTEMYLFGSILSSKRHKDIDILIIYEDYEELMFVKVEIQNLLPYEILHFTCLTKSEELELNFIRKTNALQLITTHYL